MLGAVDLFKAVGHVTGLSPGALLSLTSATPPVLCRVIVSDLLTSDTRNCIKVFKFYRPETYLCHELLCKRALRKNHWYVTDLVMAGRRLVVNY